MAMQRRGSVMHGVSGRMGYDQHLVPAISCDPASGRHAAAGLKPHPLQTMDFHVQWDEVSDKVVDDNGLEVPCEEFIRDVVEGARVHDDLMAGMKRVQRAELRIESWHGRRWLSVPGLEE